MSTLLPGAVYGRAGAGLEHATWAANASVAMKGRSAELSTGTILNTAAANPGGPSVAHHVMRPSIRADVDHVVVSGRHVYLFDSKCWAPGIYVTLPRATWRKTQSGWNKAEHVPRPGPDAAQLDMQNFFNARAIEATVHPTRYVLWPSQPGQKIRTALLRLPTMSPARLTRWSDRLHTGADEQILAALLTLMEKD